MHVSTGRATGLGWQVGGVQAAYVERELGNRRRLEDGDWSEEKHMQGGRQFIGKGTSPPGRRLYRGLRREGV